MSFRLPPQTPINPAADVYAATCLERSWAAQAALPRRDCAFGPDPWQRLDLYAPPGARDLPVFAFWHGGGYTHGYKEWCGFMAPAVTALGAVFASVSYRLVPEVSHAEIMADARAAVRWLLDHVSDHGGDPTRLVIGGHSAGANITAKLALDAASRRAAGIGDDAIAAVFAMSGSYFDRHGDRHPDPARRPPPDAPEAPADFIGPCASRFHLAWGTSERDPFPQAGRGFADALAAAGIAVTALPFAGDDHFSVHLNTADPANPWLRDLAAELARTAGPVPAGRSLAG